MFIIILTQLLLICLLLKSDGTSIAYIFGILFGWFYCKKNLIRDKIISKLFDDLYNLFDYWNNCWWKNWLCINL